MDTINVEFAEQLSVEQITEKKAKLRTQIEEQNAVYAHWVAKCDKARKVLAHMEDDASKKIAMSGLESLLRDAERKLRGYKLQFARLENNVASEAKRQEAGERLIGGLLNRVLDGNDLSALQNTSIFMDIEPNGKGISFRIRAKRIDVDSMDFGI